MRRFLVHGLVGLALGVVSLTSVFANSIYIGDSGGNVVFYNTDTNTLAPLGSAGGLLLGCCHSNGLAYDTTTDSVLLLDTGPGLIDRRSK